MTKSTITLTAEARKETKRVKDLKNESRILGVLYGHNIKNQPIECDYQSFHKVFVKAGESTVIDLEINGKATSVLIHQIAYNPMTNEYIHVDFFAPDMTKKITANIPVRLEGESPCVKDLGGILVRNRESITVKCLPKDLPHDIVINISGLKEFYDAVTIAEVIVDPKVTIMDEPDEIVVSVQAPRVEEVATPTEEEGAVIEDAEAAKGDEKEGEDEKVENKK